MKKAKIIKTFLAFITMLSTLFLFNQPVNAANKEDETGSVMKKIKQSKELVVGTSADYPPLEFTTSENGNTKYVGVDVRKYWLNISTLFYLNTFSYLIFVY